MQFLQGLNEAQKKAVATLEGPLLVLAGAGAGKTKTITYRILNLIYNGVDPKNILAVTFTNKAAKEMRERLARLLKEAPELNRPINETELPLVATFHGLGAYIIKENAEAAGVRRHFSIYDKSDSKRLVKEVLEKTGFDSKEYDPGKIVSIISREKGNLVSPESYLEKGASSFFGEVVGKVWQEYERSLKEENALDFDDLLGVAARLLEQDSIRRHYSERFKYVHIDEYQDTNRVQYQIANAIVRDHQNICAVGDIDQNIYSWRGANIRNILNFEKDYKAAKLVVLEENYRSTQTILAVANKIIEKNKFRREKVLVTRNGLGERVGIFEALTEGHEAQFVAEKVRELAQKGVALEEIAVLYRANFQSRILEEEFLTKNIPYQVLGTRFFDRKEVKDVLSFLRLSFNPDSISDLKRVINVPARGIGKTTLLKIVSGQGGTLPKAMQAKLANFKQTLAKIKEFATDNPPSKTILFITKTTGLQDTLDNSDEGVDRKENIKELSVLASRYDNILSEENGIKSWASAIEQLLEDTSLASDQDSDEAHKPGVRLMTVHASKGLEFAYVFVVGLEAGLFPHDRDENLSEARLNDEVGQEDSEEERRLFYVAVTRAKKRLFLSYAQTRTIFGSRNINIPSEFVLEIPDEYTEREFLDYTPRHKPLLHIEF